MKFIRHRTLINVVGLILLCGAAVEAQTANANPQVWPEVKVDLDLWPKTRLQLSQGLEAGDSFRKWTTAAMLSYRMKRLLIPSRRDNDEENQHTLVIAGGYEYLRQTQNGKIKNENRIVLAGTGHFRPGGGFLLSERNRIEFRWVEGTYDFRYRNKITIDHPFKAGEFSFIPYASGELFYDRNHHSWNENQYAFGSQFPYKKLLMLDAYYLHKNCTTCDPKSVNVLGLTLNLFVRKQKK